MAITRLTGTEEKILSKIRNIHGRIGTRKTAEDPFYVEEHDDFFAASAKVLDSIVESPRDKGVHQDLLFVIREATAELLHTENTRARTETRYRTQVRDHLPRFEAETAYIKNLVELATAMGAIEKGSGYINVLNAYTKMRTATTDLISYANRFLKGTSNGKNVSTVKTFRDKVTNAFAATVGFREAIEEYTDRRYHAAVDVTGGVDAAEESALTVFPQITLTQTAQQYLLEEHGYKDIVEGYHKGKPDMIGALLFIAEQDPNLMGRVDQLRHRVTISTSGEYLAEQRTQRSALPNEPFNPSMVSPISPEDATHAIGNLYGSSSLAEQRGDMDTARLLM